MEANGADTSTSTLHPSLVTSGDLLGLVQADLLLKRRLYLFMR